MGTDVPFISMREIEFPSDSLLITLVPSLSPINCMMAGAGPTVSNSARSEGLSSCVPAAIEEIRPLDPIPNRLKIAGKNPDAYDAPSWSCIALVFKYVEPNMPVRRPIRAYPRMDEPICSPGVSDDAPGGTTTVLRGSGVFLDGGPITLDHHPRTRRRSCPRRIDLSPQYQMRKLIISKSNGDVDV